MVFCYGSSNQYSRFPSTHLLSYSSCCSLVGLLAVSQICQAGFHLSETPQCFTFTLPGMLLLPDIAAAYAFSHTLVRFLLHVAFLMRPSYLNFSLCHFLVPYVLISVCFSSYHLAPSDILHIYFIVCAPAGRLEVPWEQELVLLSGLPLIIWYREGSRHRVGPWVTFIVSAGGWTNGTGP